MKGWRKWTLRFAWEITIAATILSAVVLFFLLLGFPAGMALSAERDYQEPWCEAAGGEAEHVLPDRTRVDCLTSDSAIEFDFAEKWAEAVGQALYYAARTDRRAGVILILRKPGDERYVVRAAAALARCYEPVYWIETIEAYRQGSAQ